MKQFSILQFVYALYIFVLSGVFKQTLYMYRNCLCIHLMGFLLSSVFIINYIWRMCHFQWNADVTSLTINFM